MHFDPKLMFRTSKPESDPSVLSNILFYYLYIFLFCVILWCYSFLQYKILLEASFFGCLEKALPAFTCTNLTIETLEQGVKYVQS